MRKFVSEEDYKKNLATQLDLSPRTLKTLLEDHGVSPNQKIRLEFFFYSDSDKNLSLLSIELKKLGYSTDWHELEDQEGIYILSGWTAPIQMNEVSLLSWTKQMVDVGYAADCDFDGWGTDLRE